MFRAPDPVEVSIWSALSPAGVAMRLGEAIAQRGYSTPGRHSAGCFRLGGSLGDANVIVTARPYVTPGVVAGYGAMTIELRGQIVPSEEGSEIRALVSAPFKLTAFDLLLVSLFAVVVIVGIASNPAAWLTMILFILVFGFARSSPGRPPRSRPVRC